MCAARAAAPCSTTYSQAVPEPVAEADLFFLSEMAAVRTFRFSDADAQKVAQRVNSQ